MEHKLTWLHLSDIHFHPHTEWRDSAARDALLKYLQADTLRPDLIFCTGDIAFGETTKAPLSQQYQQAREFFDKLLAIWGLPKDRLFVVPGNHDINRDTVNQDAQATLTQWAEQAQSHVEKVNQRFADRPKEFQDAIARLNEYAVFVNEYLPHQADVDGRHCYARIVDINGLAIGVAGFNSVWSCAGSEDDRHLWMAAKWQFNTAKPLLEKAMIHIGLIHHPVDWLNAADRDIATRRIAADFHFWLHGHSHNAWVEPGQSHTVIAAGAVGAEQPEEFGVNWVALDFAEGQGTVYLHKYSPSDDGWVIAPVLKHAPKALWPLKLPEELGISIPPDLIPQQNPPSSPEYKPAANSVSDEIREKARLAVGKLLEKSALSELRNTLLNKHANATKPMTPEAFLIPSGIEPFPIVEKIEALHDAVRDTFRTTSEEGRSVQITQALPLAKEILEWLLLLAVPDDWTRTVIKQPAEAQSKPGIEIPEKYAVWAELGDGRLDQKPPRLALELGSNPVKVFAPNQLGHDDLERGLTHRDALTEVLRMIWIRVMKQEPPIDEDWKAQLPYTLASRHRDGDRYHVSIPHDRYTAIASNPIWAKDLGNVLAHLGIFVYGGGNGPHVLIVPEDRLLVAIREYLRLLRKYE